jgi:hypothetical protein
MFQVVGRVGRRPRASSKQLLTWYSSFLGVSITLPYLFVFFFLVLVDTLYRATRVNKDLPFHTLLEPGRRSCAVGGVHTAALHILLQVTPNYLHHPGYANFLLSARALGFSNIQTIVTDRGEKSDAEFWLLRLEHNLAFTRKLPGDAVVVFVDAVDSLVVGSPSSLLSAFGEFAQPVVFAAERLCDTWECKVFIDERLRAEERAPGRVFKYLNAGHMIGRASSLVDVLQLALNLMRQADIDDQAAFTRIWLDLNDLVAIDYDSSLFGVVSPSPSHFLNDWAIPYSLSEAPLLVRASNSSVALGIHRIQTGRAPIFVHFAGMRYEHRDNQKMNTCQAFQVSLYNALGAHLQSSWSSRKPFRVVLSLTTTPMRIFHLRPVLEALLRQTHPVDSIYLNVPYYSIRFKRDYVIPHYLTRIPAVTIVRCDDYGPLTKLLPTLERETDPETVIITVDDEYVYSPLLAEHLVGFMQRWPKAAYGFAGQNVETEPRLTSGFAVRSVDKAEYNSRVIGVDILEAFLGAAFKRTFFDIRALSNIDRRCITTDDIWISHHLQSRGVPRVKLPFDGIKRPVELQHDALSPLRHLNIGGRQNSVCAAALFEGLRSGWLKQAIEPCPVAFSRIEKHIEEDGHRSFGKFDIFWNISSTHSPCNPLLSVHVSIGVGEKLLPGDVLVSTPQGAFAMLTGAGEFFVAMGRPEKSQQVWHMKASVGKYDDYYVVFDHLARPIIHAVKYGANISSTPACADRTMLAGKSRESFKSVKLNSAGFFITV